MENPDIRRDYEKEREQLFDDAIMKIDPQIQKTIDLIEKINGLEGQVNYEISISCTGTTI
jgi:hypothetical protein